MPCNCRVSCNFIKKETLAQLFSCEFCEISKNNFLTEHLRTTASVTLLQLHTYFHLPLFPYRSSHRMYSIKKGYIKFRKIHRKPSVLEPLFNKNAGLQPIKRRLHRRCFPVNIPKFEIEWSYYQKCSHFLDKYLTSCLIRNTRYLSKQFWCPLYGTKNSILQLSFETQSSFWLFVCFCFCLNLLSYWNSFAIAILEIKLRVIYMFHICSCLIAFAYITYITYWRIQRMKIWSFNT